MKKLKPKKLFLFLLVNFFKTNHNSFPFSSKERKLGKMLNNLILYAQFKPPFTKKTQLKSILGSTAYSR